MSLEEDGRSSGLTDRPRELCPERDPLHVGMWLGFLLNASMIPQALALRFLLGSIASCHHARFVCSVTLHPFYSTDISTRRVSGITDPSGIKTHGMDREDVFVLPRTVAHHVMMVAIRGFNCGSRKRENMRTITLATQKGGTGKSSLAIGLAVAAMKDGERVVIVDTDRQGTVSNWAARRDDPEPGVERILDRFILERALSVFGRRGYTLAIVDTPGSDDDIVTEAVRIADLCLIPAKPSPADIEATHPTLKAIRRFGRRFAFVLNQAPVRGQRPTRIAETLNDLGVLALPYIALRNDHMDSLAAGLAVSEFAPGGKAAAEIRDLWSWSKHRLTGDLPAGNPSSEFVRNPLAPPAVARAPEKVENNPLHNMILQSLRLAALPWSPWLRPSHVSSSSQVEPSRSKQRKIAPGGA
jgi:chromosome partitioning protein